MKSASVGRPMRVQLKYSENNIIALNRCQDDILTSEAQMTSFGDELVSINNS